MSSGNDSPIPNDPTLDQDSETVSTQSQTNDDEDLLTQGRARLLGKLLEERRRASRPVDDVERRLRTRALVRVRLAAEKRATEG